MSDTTNQRFSGTTASGGSTPPPVAGAVTPSVTVTVSPSASISTPQALSVVVGVASSAGAPADGLVPREITVGSDDRTLYLTNYNSGSFQVISTTVQ